MKDNNYPQLSESDQLGRIFISCRDHGTGLQAYYDKIKKSYFRRYVGDKHIYEFYNHITGCYINQVANLNKECPIIRYSYFTPYPKKLKKIETILNRIWGKKNIIKERTEDPRPEVIDPMYGPNFMNGNFRFFLNATTNIFIRATKKYDMYDFVDSMIAIRQQGNSKSVLKHLIKYIDLEVFPNVETKKLYCKLCDFNGWVHFWINLAVGCDMNLLDRAIYDMQPRKIKKEMINKFSKDIVCS